MRINKNAALIVCMFAIAALVAGFLCINKLNTGEESFFTYRRNTGNDKSNVGDEARDNDGSMRLSKEQITNDTKVSDDISKQKLLHVKPKVYDKAFRNSLEGFRGGSVSEQGKYVTVVRDYIGWNEIENNANDGVDKIIQVCNKRWAGLEQKNITVEPRVYLQYPGQGTFFPSDMTTWDFTSDNFNERVKKLIDKLGQAWDNDPRVSSIEMGIYGNWGEQHLSRENPSNQPVRMSEKTQKVLGDAFTAAFKNKKIKIRYAEDFKNYKFGVYDDSYGHFSEVYREKFLIGRGDYWKTSPLGGECAYDWGESKIQPGDNPNDTLSDPVHRKYLISKIRQFHCTGLGWVSNYSGNDSNLLTGADEVQKNFGYRYIIEDFAYNNKISEDGRLYTSVVVKNIGSAPFYYDWKLQLCILDASTKKLVWKKSYDSDIRKWLPGDDWDSSAMKYKTEAKSYTVNQNFDIPKEYINKEYIVALCVAEPTTNKANLRFAIENYINGGYHPMGYVGYNVETNIRDIQFDSLAEDTSINYSKGK